jgi:ribose transport system permease protein
LTGKSEPTTFLDRASAVGHTITRRYLLIVILIFVLVGFSLAKPDTYFTSLNFVTIGQNQAITLLLSLAVLLPLISGEFDLSMANTFGLAQLMAAGLITRNHLNPILVAVIVIAIGAVIGAVNAFAVVKMKINSFIATLGIGTVVGGLATWYSQGSVILGHFPNGFAELGQASWGSFPVVDFYAIVATILLWVVLTYLVFGRQTYATGANRTAARLSGIRTGRIVSVSFIICGAASALTGIILASQLGSGEPLVGANYLLPAYTGAFLGATVVLPGMFNPIGTAIGVYLLGAGVAGLQQIGLPPFGTDLFNGAALVIAVGFSGYASRLGGRSLWQRLRTRISGGGEPPGGAASAEAGPALATTVQQE